MEKTDPLTYPQTYNIRKYLNDRVVHDSVICIVKEKTLVNEPLS